MSELASAIGDEWSELAADGVLRALSHHAGHTLRTLLPKDLTDAGVAWTHDGGLIVVAVDDAALFTVELTPAGDDGALTTATRRAVQGAGVVIAVTDGADGPTPDGGYEFSRTWTFRWPDQAEVSFRTRLRAQVRVGAFARTVGASRAEGVARSAAAMAGWKLPTEDA